MEKLFEDLDFNKTTHIPGIIWKRPHEIVNNPSFIDDDINIDDISQGQLSNCWLIATLNILIHDWNNFLNLLNPFQSFKQPYYTGKFTFYVFDKFKEKTKIEIDDLLPTINNKLIFCKNKSNKNEFWCSLLEKALAKFIGNSYISINKGQYLDEALKYFGIYDFDYFTSKEIDISKEYFDFENYYYLLGSNDFEGNKITDQIVPLHAYSALEKIILKENQYLKIKNPYNDQFEYNYQVKITEDFSKKNDGIFWMKLDENFSKYFPFILRIKKQNVKRKLNEYQIKIKSWNSIVNLDYPIFFIGIILSDIIADKPFVLHYTCSLDKNFCPRKILAKKDFKIENYRKQSFLYIELNAKNLPFTNNRNITIFHKIVSNEKSLENIQICQKIHKKIYFLN